MYYDTVGTYERDPFGNMIGLNQRILVEPKLLRLDDSLKGLQEFSKSAAKNNDSLNSGSVTGRMTLRQAYKRAVVFRVTTNKASSQITFTTIPLLSHPLTGFPRYSWATH